jgi:VanZ family protein
MRKATRFFINWVPAIIWMAVIFSASSDSGSFKRSSRIIEPIIRWLFPHISDAALDWTILIVRKCAHLTEFAILGILLLRGLQKQSSGSLRDWRWSRTGQAWLLVVLYASSDEFHQIFVPNRQASVVDVLIDSTGAAIGLMLAWAFSYWLRSRKESPLEFR